MLLSHGDNLHKKDVYLFLIRVEFIIYNPILTMKNILTFLLCCFDKETEKN